MLTLISQRPGLFAYSLLILLYFWATYVSIITNNVAIAEFGPGVMRTITDIAFALPHVAFFTPILFAGSPRAVLHLARLWPASKGAGRLFLLFNLCLHSVATLLVAVSTIGLGAIFLFFLAFSSG